MSIGSIIGISLFMFSDQTVALPSDRLAEQLSQHASENTADQPSENGGAQVAKTPTKKVIAKRSKPRPKKLTAKPIDPINAQTPPPIQVKPYIAPQNEAVPLPYPPPNHGEIITQSPAPQIPHSHEINLRCETVATVGQRSSTKGVFFISLVRSEINPDEFADFRIMSIDPKHRSIVRDTTCFTYKCTAVVSPTYYDLASQFKNRDMLKITLNRETGAFYGREVRTKALIPGINMGSGEVTTIDEKGFCAPVGSQKTLF